MNQRTATAPVPRITGILALVSLLSFVGCGPEAPAPSSSDSPVASSGSSSSNPRTTEEPAEAVSVNTELQGRVDVDGSSTVYPITEAAAANFAKQFPNVNVNVGVSGTGGGFERFTKGETDISDASRPIKAEEFDLAVENEVKFVEVPVAYDGLTIVVHKDNDWVDQLTIDEVKKIFNLDTAAKTWSAVRNGWPEEPIKIFAPGTDSGTFDYFKEVVAGKKGSLRDDMSTSEDDNVLVTGVKGSPTSIGFFGYAYFAENRESLKAVPIVNPSSGEAVSPDSVTIESGEYAPFSRPLFIYVNTKSLSRPEVKKFVNYYLENAAELAAANDYVPLPSSIYERAQNLVRKRTSGTHYVDSEGEKRSGAVTAVYTDENRNEG